MSADHILVDGYNILHRWEEFRKLRAGNWNAARQTLIQLLTRFHDCRGGQLTVVFDGRSQPGRQEALRTGISVVYSRSGESADAVIERIIGQSAQPRQFLVATDDLTEQSLAESLGAETLSADAFHSMVADELKDLDGLLEQIAGSNRGFNRR